MDLRMAAALIVPLISTAITTNKIIAGVVVLVIIVAAVGWWMSRRRRLLACAGNAGRQPALASPRLPEAVVGPDHQRDRRRDYRARLAHARHPAVPHQRGGHRVTGRDATPSLPGPPALHRRPRRPRSTPATDDHRRCRTGDRPGLDPAGLP